MFARQQAAALMAVKEHAAFHNAAIVAIGSGACDQAKQFAIQFNFTGEIYVDPKLQSYKAFGLERGILKTLGPSSIVKGLQTLGKGFRQGRQAGDLWQQGGIFVLGPGEQIVYEHRDEVAGDLADMDSVIGVCPLR